jgi:hypothetical protein
VMDPHCHGCQSLPFQMDPEEHRQLTALVALV